MPIVYSTTAAPEPVSLRINLYARNGGYSVELLDLSADAPPIEEQRAGLTKEDKRATRIFTTDVKVCEVIPYVVEVDGASTVDTPIVEDEVHKP